MQVDRPIQSESFLSKLPQASADLLTKIPMLTDHAVERLLSAAPVDVWQPALALAYDGDFMRKGVPQEQEAVKRLSRGMACHLSKPFSGFLSTPPVRKFDDGTAADRLRRDGVTRLPDLFTAGQIEEIHEHFAEIPMFNGHLYEAGDGRRRHIGDPSDPAEQYQFGSFHPTDILGCRPIAELMRSEALYQFMSEYFGVLPMVYGIQLWWSFPGQQVKGGPQPDAGQMFHRDFAALHDLQLFCLLSDAEDADGRHLYIRHSHSWDMFQQYVASISAPETAKQGLLNFVMRTPNDGYYNETYFNGISPFLPIEEIYGLAGTSFVESAGGLHKGEPPMKRHRLMFSIRFVNAPDPALCKGTTFANWQAYVQLFLKRHGACIFPN